MKKPFIVIGGHEPYFPEAYELIRICELAKGTWTEECESSFQEAIDWWYEYSNDSPPLST